MFPTLQDICTQGTQVWKICYPIVDVGRSTCWRARSGSSADRVLRNTVAVPSPQVREKAVDEFVSQERLSEHSHRALEQTMDVPCEHFQEKRELR